MRGFCRRCQSAPQCASWSAGPCLPPQAAFLSAAKLCVRSLNSSESVAAIVFVMAAVSTAGAAALCAALPHHWRAPPSALAWALLLSTGVMACGVQWLATIALKLCRAAPVVAMSFTTGKSMHQFCCWLGTACLAQHVARGPTPTCKPSPLPPPLPALPCSGVGPAV